MGWWAAKAVLVVTVLGVAGQPAAAPPRSDAAVAKGVIELLTGGSSGPAIRVAEDLATLFEDAAPRRLIPVIGQGGSQDLKDLVLVRGIDMAILQADVVDNARRQRDLPAGENSFTYIARLHDEEFHLLARADIRSVADLAGKKVNLGRVGSGTVITAGRLFELLGTQVEAVNERPDIALMKLRRGEIAAMAYVARRPDPLFAAAPDNKGLHFIPIPLNAAIVDEYLPATLSATDYPGLVATDAPIETVAVGTLLAIANVAQDTDRYRNLTAFVEAFFTRFPILLEPGHDPRWRDINPAADLPGWKRFPFAADWLSRKNPVTAPDAGDAAAAFSKVVGAPSAKRP